MLYGLQGSSTAEIKAEADLSHPFPHPPRQPAIPTTLTLNAFSPLFHVQE